MHKDYDKGFMTLEDISESNCRSIIFPTLSKGKVSFDACIEIELERLTKGEDGSFTVDELATNFWNAVNLNDIKNVILKAITF